MRGYWGDPAHASAEKGKAEIQEALGKVFPKMRAVWDGVSPHWIFRSWYSILPPNKSLFKAWLLFISIVALIVAWGIMNSALDRL